MFHQSFIIFSLVAVAFGGVLPNGINRWEGRIVGGNTAYDSQFPYQISLRTSGNSHFCGGSIVNSRWIVTAAHCTAGQNPTNVRVVVGTNYQQSGGLSHQVSLMYIHAKFDGNTLAFDISVVQTASIITFNNAVQPIPLSSFTVEIVDAIGSGWGQLSNPGNSPNALQWINLKSISNTECRSRLPANLQSRILDSVICTLSPPGQGMCMGDSGGPLASGGKLIGLVSWGIPCAGGTPDMFTRISSYRSWIISLTG